jgi:hypothetical protein
MSEDYITYEFKSEPFMGNIGHREYKNSKKGQWHWGVADNTTISVYSRAIQREAKFGGRIIIVKSWGEDKVIDIEPCPTGHANIVDDFMGGSLCKDCRANW